jgi:hypothetical protein
MVVDVEDVEGIARWAYEALPAMHAGTVLAIWHDGSMSEEGFGFRGRRQEDGRLVEPVASFPGRVTTNFWEVRRRVLLGFVRRGLLPPVHGEEFIEEEREG